LKYQDDSQLENHKNSQEGYRLSSETELVYRHSHGKKKGQTRLPGKYRANCGPALSHARRRPSDE